MTDGAYELSHSVELGSVRRSIVLLASVEAVWAALTDPEQLSAWLGGEVELDPFPGGQIAVQEDGRLRRGVIVDMEPLHHFEIRWLPPSTRLGFLWGPDDEPAGLGGALEFTLTPVPERGATQLTVVERAPTPAALAVA